MTVTSISGPRLADAGHALTVMGSRQAATPRPLGFGDGPPTADRGARHSRRLRAGMLRRHLLGGIHRRSVRSLRKPFEACRLGAPVSARSRAASAKRHPDPSWKRRRIRLGYSRNLPASLPAQIQGIAAPVLALAPSRSAQPLAARDGAAVAGDRCSPHYIVAGHEVERLL